MAGEVIREYGSWVDLETNGASISNNNFAEADDAGFSLATNGGDRPHLQFELEATFSVAPAAGSAIALHHAPQDLFGGTNDGRVPSANNFGGWLHNAVVENTTATQRWRFDLLMAPTDSKYHLQNLATGQTISAGWKLRARAFSFKVA